MSINNNIVRYSAIIVHTCFYINKIIMNSGTKLKLMRFKEAELQSADPTSCIELRKTVLHVALLPCYLGRIPDGVRDNLDRRLGLYTDEWVPNYKIQERYAGFTPRSDLLAYLLTYILASLLTYIFTLTYLHTYLPTYLLTSIHTYIHTYLFTYLPTYLSTYLLLPS